MGHERRARVDIFDRKSDRLVMSTTINLGEPYLDDSEVERVLASLPSVQEPNIQPLDGKVYITRLRDFGAKVVNIPWHAT